MGILNISDDSFYDGGRYNSLDKAISRVSEMINQGVDSSRINTSSVSNEQPLSSQENGPLERSVQVILK